MDKVDPNNRLQLGRIYIMKELPHVNSAFLKKSYKNAPFSKFVIMVVQTQKETTNEGDSVITNLEK